MWVCSAPHSICLGFLILEPVPCHSFLGRQTFSRHSPAGTKLLPENRSPLLDWLVLKFGWCCEWNAEEKAPEPGFTLARLFRSLQSLPSPLLFVFSSTAGSQASSLASCRLPHPIPLLRGEFFPSPDLPALSWASLPNIQGRHPEALSQRRIMCFCSPLSGDALNLGGVWTSSGLSPSILHPENIEHLLCSR